MRTPLASLLVLTLLLAGCSGTTTEPPAGKTVDLTGSRFSPDTLAVTAGSTVHFANKDSVRHVITIHDQSGNVRLDKKTVEGGQSFDFAFPSAGDYHVFCEIHPNMVMSVTTT
jgi:plastocyanin